MITLTQYPTTPALSREPILVGLKGNKMYESLGSYAFLHLYINIGATIVAGDNFTLNYLDKSLLFMFVNTPDDSGTQYAVPPGGTITQPWTDNFLTEMQNNYYMMNDWTRSGYTFTFFQKTAINLTVENNIVSNSFGFSVVPGFAPVLRENYQLICNLYSETGKLIASESQSPTSDGNAIFDLSDYIFSQLLLTRQTVATIPWTGTSNFIKHPTHSAQFYIRYAETWDGIVRQMTKAPTFTALMATTRYSDMSFLTLQKTKSMAVDANERLFFYNKTARKIKLKSVVETNETTLMPVTIESFSASEGIYEIRANIVQTAAPPTESGYITGYRIFLTDEANNVICKSINYSIDYRYYRHQEYFVYRNRLGGYDLLRCVGRTVSEGKIDRETFEDETKTRYNYSNVIEQIFTANTGSISAETIHDLDELLLSAEVYWLRENVLTPIIITQKKGEKLTDDQRRFNLSFEFSIAKKQLMQ